MHGEEKRASALAVVQGVLLACVGGREQRAREAAARGGVLGLAEGLVQGRRRSYLRIIIDI